MNEREFLKQLEGRAQEQEQLIKQMPFRNIFVISSLWLGEHPWRFLIPLAVLLTLFFRIFLGPFYYEFILKIFGGFGLIR